jgi:hypothetical protein
VVFKRFVSVADTAAVFGKQELALHILLEIFEQQCNGINIHEA